MGQKIHPNSVRLGYIRNWQSRWVADFKDMPQLIREDYEIRNMVKEKFLQAAVSSVIIERLGNYLKITINTARPGIVIGRKGQDIETLRAELERMTGKKVYINVFEIKVAELDATLVAQSIAFQLEKRVSYKRACKKAMEKTMASGALGIKVMVSGRLGGAKIARREWYRKGRVPLQTFSADVDYGFAEANTVMGKIGVKVWIFKKLFFAKTPRELQEELKKMRLEEEKQNMIVGENISKEENKGDQNVDA
ncbi:MAG TPA: 30S ribosomal protein S3 [Elusimicrobiales bacterium]|nr:30S ribosomal protein S3 [Elusimicrobiales bacterium]HOL61865.1 30S ribosomal protein S3 [Elusimicrobiales bacterium]HPO95083.1 30S ribosomal protein S3 [Elusimicrobiales bacterium]